MIKLKYKTIPKIQEVEITQYKGNKDEIFKWLNSKMQVPAIYDDGGNLGILCVCNNMYYYPKIGQWIVNFGNGDVEVYETPKELERDFSKLQE